MSAILYTLGYGLLKAKNTLVLKFCKKMVKWGKSDNMILNFYPSQASFAKHIFH